MMGIYNIYKLCNYICYNTYIIIKYIYIYIYIYIIYIYIYIYIFIYIYKYRQSTVPMTSILNKRSSSIM